MASQGTSLTSIPLEIRHAIFAYAAAREARPKNLLRYWFEKQEIKEIMAKQQADNPDGVKYQAAHDHEIDSDSSSQGDYDDAQGEGDDGEDGEEAEEQEGESEQVDNEGDDEHDIVENDDDIVDDASNTATANTATTLTAPAPPVVVVKAHRKWRHIPNFMYITHYPPPVELLQTSRQFNADAKDWYYNVAVLHIEATASFAHTSFFEEAFQQITDAAFSPMENIRKVDVTFVWDTAWVRSQDDAVQNIFPALLHQRADFVHRILRQAPDLKHLVIHWHDSTKDLESINLRNDVLSGFYGLQPRVAIIEREYYIAADAKPHIKSIAGRRRVEFQGIVDDGLDRLF